MTVNLSTAATNRQKKFDSGPLSWVMDEIRGALDQSRTALQNALGKDQDATATLLNQAGAYLHQAHGALQIVDVDGATIITECVEDILRRISDGDLHLTRVNVKTIEQSFLALTEYLEELLAGEEPRPIRLFPYYKDLQEIRKAERIHPADLFFADPDSQGKHAPLAPAMSDTLRVDANIPRLRPRFEKALLALLTSKQSPAQTKGVADLLKVVTDIEHAQSHHKLRDFWWVMRGFLETVVSSDTPVPLFTKQVCGRMNRQIKVLAQGSPNVSDRLMLDTLYCIAQEEKSSPIVEEIRDAYQLRDLIPVDFEEKRYGLIDTVTLGVAKSTLNQAKNTWYRVTQNESGAADAFIQLADQLTETCSKLNSQSLVKLLDTIRARSASLRTTFPSRPMGLEVAADLLFIENALDHLNRIPEDFPQRVEALIDRLNAIAEGKSPPESAQWIDELTEQSEQRQTIGVLSGEMEGSLRQIEKLLNTFFNDPSQYPVLADIDPMLHQIAGVLSVLGAEDAMLAAEHARQTIRQYKAALDAGNDATRMEFPQSITQNITALGFFVEILPQHPETAKTRFQFDRDQGILVAHLLERGVARPAALSSANPAFDPLLDVENDTGAPHMPMPVAKPAPKIQPTAPLPLTDEEIDAELLDIFMSEAEEVLAFVSQALPAAKLHASDQDQLSTIRRSFHTLKGSGRMVGLKAFAEASYSVEQVMNLWLAEAKSGTPDLFALLEKSVDELSKWVADLREHGKSNRTPIPLSNAANLIKTGHPFHFDDTTPLAASEPAPPPDEPVPAEPAQTSLPPHTSASSERIAQAIGEKVSDVAPAPAEPLPPVPVTASEPGSAREPQHLPEAEAPNIIDFPMPASPALSLAENTKCIGHLEISLQLFNIYVAETDVLLRTLTQDFSEWRHEPERAPSSRAIHAAHSLAGSSATVGLSSIQELAHALELHLHKLTQHRIPMTIVAFDTLQDCLECFRQMMEKVALGEFPDPQPDLIQQLQDLQNPADPSTTPPHEATDIATPDDSLGIPDEVIALSSDENEDADEEEDAPEHKDHIDPDLLAVFLDEGRELLPSIGEGLRLWTQQPTDLTTVPDILRHLHTAKGSARMAGAMFLGHQLHLMETQIEDIQHAGPVTANMLDNLMAKHDYNMQLFEHLQNPDDSLPAPSPIAPSLQNDAAVLASEPSPDAFPADATDALPASDTAAPVITSEAEPPAAPALSDKPDAASPTLAPVTPFVPPAPAMPVAAASSPATTPATAPATPAAPVARVRVRADVLDRLVNQAGEVSIARSKIENEVDTLRGSLSELTENLSRLRGQLREVEIQAESQITSRSQTADREFDPLEFDRFSRLQELTRMMSESVDDVASIQDSLLRTVTGAASDLETQANLTRSLQQDLMQVRMVPFSSISERLYQIARQASKEMNKSVNLDIKGTSVEVDRGVLERMTGPLEHLLRNAIVHGVESRENRKNAGKPETGQLLVEIRQEGNEVSIVLSDDGQGLDLARIREKAVEAGIVTKDRELTTGELENMIFQPGFSTAAEVTSLAGRGVGLDVVRAEASSLGGRVNVQSESGKGTQFTVHLPLTLAVTSVVLMQTGGTTYAVPSVLVEQVQQLTISALTAAYNEGAIVWQGARVPIFFLSALLGDAQSVPVAQQYTPVLILRSGTERVAIHVDEVAGNREVVVKNIGPQLARMIGIVGATVLGSGNIVLILDPVALGQRHVQEGKAASQIAPTMAAESSPLPALPLSPQTIEPPPVAQAEIAKDPTAQGLRKKNIVMVVDDSLTVRRVTQRFLQREGYQVVLAKDGVDALEKLQEVKPDVMLVDIEMPRMDGFDLIRNVRNDSRVAKTPIIMITSRTASKHRNYAMELGANEYYGKPFQEHQLLESIEEFVGKDPSKEPAPTR